MKKLLLFGAFDRYNYGDNLMPILFDEYIKKYHQDFAGKISVEFVSISDSDLTKYKCKKTRSINGYIEMLNSGDAIIVIGGEVLTATNSILFLHMQNNRFLNVIYKYLKKILRNSFSLYSDRLYSTKWEYPYLPEQKMLPDGVKVIYNTVGGGFGGVKSQNDKNNVINRVKNAAYFSVRDERTKLSFNDFRDVVLAPDSAFIMSDLISDDFLSSNVREFVKDNCREKYFVFQSAPDKLGCSVDLVSNELEKISSEISAKVILLPIGYASGHDDELILSKIHKKIKADCLLLTDLNIWEIMYVIKNSCMFFGTSLHGVITAMSFKVPYFGVNENVEKLDAFLKQWSIAPFNRCYPSESLSKLPSLIISNSKNELDINTDAIIDMVKHNNNEIIKVIES